MLGAPASIGLPHVCGRLDGGDELEGDIGETDEADDGPVDLREDVFVEKDAADKDVDYMASLSVQIENRRKRPQRRRGRTDAAADEREHERGIARDLGRDLELCAVSRLVVSSHARAIRASGCVIPSKAVAIKYHN